MFVGIPSRGEVFIVNRELSVTSFQAQGDEGGYLMHLKALDTQGKLVTLGASIFLDRL
jgi:hypothetical protein